MNDKLIHDYLEGELDSTSQELLFAELNSNLGMRQEFDYQMKLNKIIEMDRNASSTPTELTAALFNKLNYSIPLANNAKLISTKRRYFWRYAVAMLLLLFISIPSSIIVYNKYHNDNENGNAINSDKSEPNQSISKNNDNIGIANTSNSNISNNIIANSNQEYNADNRRENSQGIIVNSENAKTKISKNSTNLNNSNGINSNNNAMLEEDATVAESKLVQVKNSAPEYNRNEYWNSNNIGNNEAYMKSSSIVMSISPIIDDLLSLLTDDNFEININIKNNINNYPPTQLNTASNFYDNMGLSLWYNFQNGIDAGLEFGRESFSQSFTTVNGLIYKQVPTLNFIGLGIRYTAYQLELPLESVPYVQFNASASTIGPIFNIQSGLNLASYSKVSVRLGIEYTSLLYNVNSNIYNSGKVNLIGGIVYSF